MKTISLPNYIVYDLNNCPKCQLNNFTLKNGLFGVTNIAKNSDKSKYLYNYGIAFDGLGSHSFGNGIERNASIFDVDNSSLSQ